MQEAKLLLEQQQHDVESSSKVKKHFFLSRQHYLSGLLAFVLTGLVLLTRSHAAFDVQNLNQRALAGAGHSYRSLHEDQRPTLHLVGLHLSTRSQITR